MATATYVIEVDWNNDGDFGDANEDITADVKEIRYIRGKEQELGKSYPGILDIRVNNADGKYSPTLNTGIYTNLLPKRAIRVYRPELDSASWLTGWGPKRIKLTIDSGDIDSALSNFPILVYLSASSGINSDDVSAVFDELTADANRKKIAVTTSDGKTECYVEIEKWDDANEKAWLWVKVPSVSNTTDTDLYLYYDSLHSANTTYVGDPSDAVVHNVWDDNFVFVSHMRDDPDTSHIRDSTQYGNDGDKTGAGQPAVTTSGQIDDAQEFDGGDDEISVPNHATLDPTGAFTLEAWVKPVDDAAFGNYGIFDRNPPGSTDPYGLTLYNQQGYAGINGAGWDITAAGTFPWGVFSKISLTYDKDLGSNQLKLFDNDTIVGQATSTAVLNDTNSAVIIGSYIPPYYFYEGILDEARISDIARTPAWIAASYESERDHLIDFGAEETMYPLFYGYIETITPHPDLASQDCYISAVDGLDFLARHELDTILYKDQLAGYLVGKILDDAGWGGAAFRSIDAGQDTVPFAYWHKVRARFALRDIEGSELGFIYINGAGKLCYEDRHHRYSATHQTSQATFDDTMVDIAYDYSARNIYNEVRATITPWEVQSLATLWVLEENPSLAVGETKTWWGDASVSGWSVFVDEWTTLDGTDYTASGTVSVAQTNFAKTIKIAVTNTDTVPVTITLLRARGTYYDDLTKVSRKSEDATSQGLYQKRTLPLDGKYLTDADKAQDFCDYGVARFKDPQAEIILTMVNKNATNLTQILSREISDRITVQNTKLGLDADFFINKMVHEITDGGKMHRCTWCLVDATNEDFWCLNYSALGTGTKLGY